MPSVVPTVTCAGAPKRAPSASVASCVLSPISARKNSTAVVTSGDFSFASRGRRSYEYWPRASNSRFERMLDEYWPTTVLVRSFSVPLLESALTVVSASALPVALAFLASLSLKL